VTAHTTSGSATATGSAVAPRDWWVIAGMTTAAASAAVASFAGLRGLATAAGWPARLAWLLPVTIDAYAMTSARVWLAGTPGQPAARRFARANALGAIGASIAGNAAYHAIGAGLLAVTWPVVVLVGAVPATVLGLTAHLHALRGRTVLAGQPEPEHSCPAALPRGRSESGTGSGNESHTQAGTESGPRAGTESGPGSGIESRTPAATESDTRNGTETGIRDGTEAGTVSRPRVGPHAGPRASRVRTRAASRRRPRHRTEAELMAAARDADARHRQTHGRPITRDALRAALRISGPRATELRRLLAAAPGEAQAPASPAAGAAPPGDPPAEPLPTRAARAAGFPPVGYHPQAPAPPAAAGAAPPAGPSTEPLPTRAAPAPGPPAGRLPPNEPPRPPAGPPTAAKANRNPSTPDREEANTP
jgi:hypothetical protein